MYFRILKQNEMKKTLSILGTILIIYIIVFSCNKIISGTMRADINNSLAKSFIEKQEIIKAKEYINSNAPIKIDENTTAVKAEYLENENKFSFYFLVKNLKKGDKTDKEINLIVQSLRDSDIKNLKNNPDQVAFVHQQVTLAYIYKDINDSIFCSYQILPKDYLSK